MTVQLNDLGTDRRYRFQDGHGEHIVHAPVHIDAAGHEVVPMTVEILDQLCAAAGWSRIEDEVRQTLLVSRILDPKYP